MPTISMARRSDSSQGPSGRSRAGDGAKLHRRVAQAPADATVEIGQIVEAARVRNVDDLDVPASGILEHGARLLQSQPHDALAERHASLVQQVLNVAGRQAELVRNPAG